MFEEIYKNLEMGYSTENLEYVHYSSSHFGQIFLKKTGHSPLNYFSQLKIQKACQMLDFTDKKIKEISFELGFYDPYHFSKTFFKITGETPSQYKKRNKG